MNRVYTKFVERNLGQVYSSIITIGDRYKIIAGRIDRLVTLHGMHKQGVFVRSATYLTLGSLMVGGALAYGVLTSQPSRGVQVLGHIVPALAAFLAILFYLKGAPQLRGFIKNLWAHVKRRAP